MGKLRECWAEDTRRGSQYPSRTYFWATAWSLERNLIRLNLDSISKTILSFSHGNIKGEEHVFNVVGREVGTLLIGCKRCGGPQHVCGMATRRAQGIWQCCRGANMVASVVPLSSSAILPKLRAGARPCCHCRICFSLLPHPFLPPPLLSIFVVIVAAPFLRPPPSPPIVLFTLPSLIAPPLSGDVGKRAWEGSSATVVVGQATTDNGNGHLPLRQ